MERFYFVIFFQWIQVRKFQCRAKSAGARLPGHQAKVSHEEVNRSKIRREIRSRFSRSRWEESINCR